MKFAKSFLVVAILFPINALQAQDIDPQTCPERLTEARSQLFTGAFEEVISLIEPCVRMQAYTDSEDLVQAYALLANVYFAINAEEQARETTALLLEAAPGYQPDPEQSRSDFIDTINEMRAQLTPLPPAIASITTQDRESTITWDFVYNLPLESFVLYRGPHPDSLVQQAVISVTELSFSQQADSSFQTSYTDSGLDYETRYFYVLEALAENGNTSSRSLPVDITTEAASDLAVETPVEQPSATKRKRLSPWIFVGGGVVAGGLAAVLAGGGGGGGSDPGGGNGNTPTTLITPPGLPQ